MYGQSKLFTFTVKRHDRKKSDKKNFKKPIKLPAAIVGRGNFAGGGFRDEESGGNEAESTQPTN